MSNENKSNKDIVFDTNDSAGRIIIDADVIRLIAIMSLDDIKGVSVIGKENIGIKKIVKKNSVKGVAVEINDQEVKILIKIKVDFGYSIPDVTSTVQSKVVNTIFDMTGIKVSSVDVHVADITIDE